MADSIDDMITRQEQLLQTLDHLKFLATDYEDLFNKEILAITQKVTDLEPGNKLVVKGHIRLDPMRHSCHWKEQPIKLTYSEYQLVILLASRPDVICSRNKIMDAIYGLHQAPVEERTIDSHIKRIRKKFRKVDPEFDAIETLYGVGYVWRDDYDAEEGLE